MNQSINFFVNGVARTAQAEPRTSLADVLRGPLGLTGTHVGCEHGVCGACTVTLDGAAVRSCLMFGVQAQGCHVGTVEGLATDDTLHPIQQAFTDAHALQCGFCTPGFLMAVSAFLSETPDPSDAQIREAISSNLCRCTGYSTIHQAVKAAAKALQARGNASRADA